MTLYFIFPHLEPPGKPTKINVSDKKAHEVTVTWTASEPGSDSEGSYILNCTNCPPAHSFNTNTTSTSIVLKGLSAFASYNVKITKENDITKRTGKSNPETFEFTTAEGGVYS